MRNYQEVEKLQNYKVVKSNDLIQKSRYELSLQEYKIVLYLISKIKPEDIDLEMHTFKILDFCKICGLELYNGKNYKNIKNTLRTLSDKSFWIMLEDGSETLFRWIQTMNMNKKSGIIKIELGTGIAPYLLQLKNRYTSYELLHTLAMKSQYSIRLYELLKSYEYQHKKVFNIDELKKTLAAENYELFGDFKRKVLDISMREINSLSDLNITYKPIKESRRYAEIEFTMKIKKGVNERLEMWAKIDEVINPAQMSLLKMLS